MEGWLRVINAEPDGLGVPAGCGEAKAERVGAGPLVEDLHSAAWRSQPGEVLRYSDFDGGQRNLQDPFENRSAAMRDLR